MHRNLGKIGQPQNRSTSYRNVKQARPKAHRPYSLVKLGERPRVKRATKRIDPSVIRTVSTETMLHNIKLERV